MRKRIFQALVTVWALSLVLAPATEAQSLVAAVLPASRSVQVGTPATAFATIINVGPGTATGCTLAPLTTVPADFVFQTTDPATNAVTGTPDTPVDIPAGVAQSFVFAFTPTAPFGSTDVKLTFACANAAPAPITTGLNTLLLSASATPIPDIVALAATLNNDGIVNLSSTGVFSVATVNVGASGTITVSADIGGETLPVNITLCETNPTTGACLDVPGSSVTTTINANETPTFGIFVTGTDDVLFDPAINRIFVRFQDGGGVTRGSTSVAVRTQNCSSLRTNTDQPDDSPGFQVHVMYVLPSDGLDEALDTNGTIATSVGAFNTWLAGRSGGRRLRVDTCGGALDITFFRLTRTDAEIRRLDPFIRDEIERQINEAGFNRPNKIYAVYYGGSSDFACGGGAWPPTLVGNVAALYLKGEPPGAPPCASNPFASSEATPGFLEFAMLHEILHTVGVVASCAPNHTLAGHVSDDPRDLMYAGPLPWQPSLLDVNSDDYFEHTNAECLNLAKSALLDPAAADAILPPGWPF